MSGGGPGTVAALIPAAGRGTRLGLGDKAFVQLGGLSLLTRSLRALAPHADELLVALPAGRTLPDDLGELRARVRAVTGGVTRQQTVLALLEACAAETVLIHDAARPFLTEQVARAVLAAARETGAATAALPLADTLVRAGPALPGGGARWDQRVEREGLWGVQTPQGFGRALLLSAHRRAAREGHLATDDAGLAVWAGHGVQLVPGDARLLKVTTPGDLQLAEALAAREAHEQGGGEPGTLR